MAQLVFRVPTIKTTLVVLILVFTRHDSISENKF